MKRIILIIALTLLGLVTVAQVTADVFTHYFKSSLSNTTSQQYVKDGEWIVFSDDQINISKPMKSRLDNIIVTDLSYKGLAKTCSFTAEDENGRDIEGTLQVLGGNNIRLVVTRDGDTHIFHCIVGYVRNIPRNAKKLLKLFTH